MKNALTEKGQVTIPKRVRDTLGLKPGDELDFDVVDGEIRARKKALGVTLREAVGILKLDVSGDEFIAQMRGM